MRSLSAKAALLALLPTVALAQAPDTPPAGTPAAPPATAPAPSPLPLPGVGTLPPPGAATLPQIDVIGTTPLLGSGIDRDKVPGVTYGLNRDDIRITGTPDLLGALDARIGGVTLDNAQNNPFQPNLLFRGFEASPLAGNAQGLSVYLNGSRFNQPFGDTVNWDLIPSAAINRVEVHGSNPVFGLNALGGSVAVQLKDGFNYKGGEIQLLGGSYGRYSFTMQYGKQIDNFGFYIAANGLNDDGWRYNSPSQLFQVYTDLGWRGSKGQVNLSVLAANTSLVGNGTTPVQLLDVDRTAVFTYPDETKNDYVRLNLTGRYDINDQISLQGNLYYSHLNQRTKNGDAADAEPCEDDPSQLCLDDDGPQLIGSNGAPIPNFVTNSPYLQFPAFAERFEEGGPYAQLNRTQTETHGFGAALQLTHEGELFGKPNRFLVGASYDGGRTSFQATSELGALTLDRGFAGAGGIIIVQPDGSITPVSVNATTNYYGIYASDTLDITDKVALTLSGRFNLAQINLYDQIGTSLNGSHTFSRFNPAAGVTWKVAPWITAYAGYAEANRAPTPAELSCASPETPCSLTNFFVGDPPLNQVVARTVEAGFRGNARVFEGLPLAWYLGFFYTNTDDDIMFVSSPIVGRAFFQNVGKTRRQGLEAGVELRGSRWGAFVDYAFTDATFQSPLTLNSPENPAATNGTIQVFPGNQLPGIPLQSLKFGASAFVTENWQVGFTGRVESGRWLVGDEANLTYKTSPFAVFGLNTAYNITPSVQVFGMITNIFNTNYETFGTFSPTSEVPILQVPDAQYTRSLSPGMPRAIYAGLRIRLP